MKTGTPILDKSIYLRVGVPFILLIDLISKFTVFLLESLKSTSIEFNFKKYNK